MQAVPYVWSLFLIPMHYWTHLARALPALRPALRRASPSKHNSRPAPPHTACVRLVLRLRRRSPAPLPAPRHTQILLFCTGLWTANIHDCIHGRCEPIMGAGYHAIHHLDYKSNYGHYTTLFDKVFGSLTPPKAEEKAEAPAGAEEAKKGM